MLSILCKVALYKSRIVFPCDVLCVRILVRSNRQCVLKIETMHRFGSWKGEAGGQVKDYTRDGLDY
jgi:(p)ppGpp synthase/HD superfamily hydrolase